MQPVKDIEVRKGMTAGDIVRQMHASGGFVAKDLALATDIVESMIKDKDSVNFLSFPACIVSTGTRGVLKDLIKEKYFFLV